jgi:glycine cleavage system H protein
MNIPSDLYYTKDHEWVRLDGEECTLGVTDYAQSELGDIVYLELPEVGAGVKRSTTFGAIEAVKAASDLFSPITGEIVAVNSLLEDNPELINQSPYEDGWIIKVKVNDKNILDTLLGPAEYSKIIGTTTEG